MSNTTRENQKMPLVRLLRTGQVTLPSELRRRFQLGEGDYLEAAATEDGILLRPVEVVDRTHAVERMFAAKARVRPTTEQAGKTPEEQEQEIFDEMEAMRREYAEGRDR